MKLLLIALALSSSAFAMTTEELSRENGYNVVDKIRTFELENGRYEVSFWNGSAPMSISTKSAHFHCLENAYKSHMPIALKMADKGVIQDCRLHPNPHPGQIQAEQDISE